MTGIDQIVSLAYFQDFVYNIAADIVKENVHFIVNDPPRYKEVVELEIWASARAFSKIDSRVNVFDARDAIIKRVSELESRLVFNATAEPEYRLGLEVDPSSLP